MPRRAKKFRKEFAKAIKREIPLLANSKARWLWVIVVILITLAFVLPFLGIQQFSKLFGPVIQVLVRNFGSIAVGNFFAVFIICAGFFSLIAISKIITSALTQQKQKWNTFWTWAVAVTLFMSGTIFIDAAIGSSSNQWDVFNESGSLVSNITCSDYSGALIYGHKITCKLPGDLEQRNRKDIVKIELQNESIVVINSTTKSFVAPDKDIGRIEIYMQIENYTSNLSTTFYPTFYTEERYNERKKDFLTYFLGLLFLCIITIPPLINKLVEKN